MKGDEFITPCATCGPYPQAGRVRSGDSVVFFNYRGDRPRELTKAFVYDEFPYSDSRKGGERMGFDRGSRIDLHYVTMTAYEQGLPVRVAFDKPPPMKDILGAYLAEKGCTQFRCAETEKYPHVTFFFNDYRDDPFPGEQQQLVPSPRDISTYDQRPEMSAVKVTDVVLHRIATHDDDLIVLNYANGDMVGHTGDLNAAIRAVETVDECVGRVLNAVLKKDGALIITADHGNCEQMIDPASGGPHTAHTAYDVQLTVADERYRRRSLRPGSGLADIAPTLLEMLNLPKPEAMTGSSLLLPD
jgi:2,3-bisphosphoglycerate-independent phosphoglycerate mutase